MNSTQIQIVSQTFAQVAPKADAVAEVFYHRLFEQQPQLRAMFGNDMASQRKALMGTLAFAVGALKQPEALLPAVRALGARHAGYGVQPEHFDMVGEALLWTLADAFGSAFTQDVREAWASVYGVLANTMVDAMAVPA